MTAYKNTDRELYREPEGSFYSHSLHVTAQGDIGINCGGTVFVKALREWHKMAAEIEALKAHARHERDLGAEEAAAADATVIQGLLEALEVCAKETYLDEHELVFRPTGAAKIARAAIDKVATVYSATDAKLRLVAEAAYWHLAYEWQSHLFGRPTYPDMSVFAPEVRKMMTRTEQAMFDALQELHDADT